MTALNHRYDAVIIGAGHNGLVAACYLAKAGMSVLILERNPFLGGASRSSKPFEGMEANLSVYAYLISLLPEKIIQDLGLRLTLRSRKTASWTPSVEHGNWRELLIRNDAFELNRDAFRTLTGNDLTFEGYNALQSMQQQVASVVWPSLTRPLVSRESMRQCLDKKSHMAWEALIEEPLGRVIERCIPDDLVRGLLFTDAKIGISTHPHDPSLIQNRCFLYHVIGQGTGEWNVPVGGMGTLVRELQRVLRSHKNVTILSNANARRINPGTRQSNIQFEWQDQQHEVDAGSVLCNASGTVLDQLTDRNHAAAESLEGTGFKINMLLERLPRLRSRECLPEDAFAGTVHIDEGYQQMIHSHRESVRGHLPKKPPGEMYCHSLTDDSILSEDLAQRGFHSLTLFGLDLPYSLFQEDNATKRDEVVTRYLTGINQYLEEPIESCLARDASGKPCLEAMSAIDLERKVHLPKGNIFHGDLTWPFSETEETTGTWGVETAFPNIFLCGSSAKRGGAVSGIPGHNAAMKVFEYIQRR